MAVIKVPKEKEGGKEMDRTLVPGKGEKNKHFEAKGGGKAFFCRPPWEKKKGERRSDLEKSSRPWGGKKRKGGPPKLGEEGATDLELDEAEEKRRKEDLKTGEGGGKMLTGRKETSRGEKGVIIRFHHL